MNKRQFIKVLLKGSLTIYKSYDSLENKYYSKK